MSQIDRATVAHIAELAKLALSEEETTLYTEQLSAILTYAEHLQALDTEAIPPTASVLPLRNVWRDDRVRPSLPRQQALANSAECEADRFRVVAVWDE